MRPECAPATLEVGVYRTVRNIPQPAWDACFPGDPESWAYYVAIEESGFAAFSWAYLVAREGETLVAVVPAFITDYGIDTTIQGAMRAALEPVLRRLRKFLTLRLVCLGSPHADKCHLGFSPDVATERRHQIVLRLLEALDKFAAARGIGLIGAKDLADGDLACGIGEAFSIAGFTRQPGLPNAVLGIPASEDAYFAQLSPAARREVHRKLKRGDPVQMEVRRGPQGLDLVPQMAALYAAQRAGSNVDFDQFEALTPAYFRAVLERLGEAAIVFAYLHEDRLVAFNLCFHTERLFIDKFVGFAQPLARTLNLYVLSWINNVRYCIANRIPVLQTGQTGYAMKLRMGSELRSSWIFFRHRNPILNLALRLAGPLLAADRHEADLSRHRRGAA